MSEERKKHINHLKAMLKCYENQTSPTTRCDDCDNCELQYAQGNMGEIKETLTYAIASLETDEAYQLEYEQPEFCEDCISRKEAISWIENLRTLNEHYHPNAKNNHLIDSDSAIDHLKQVPSVLPRAKTGHWIAYHYGAYYLCSNCKEQHNSRYAKYCPNCGTKMDRKVRISNDKRNYRGF